MVTGTAPSSLQEGIVDGTNDLPPARSLGGLFVCALCSKNPQGCKPPASDQVHIAVLSVDLGHDVVNALSPFLLRV